MHYYDRVIQHDFQIGKIVSSVQRNSRMRFSPNLQIWRRQINTATKCQLRGVIDDLTEYAKYVPD